MSPIRWHPVTSAVVFGYSLVVLGCNEATSPGTPSLIAPSVEQGSRVSAVQSHFVLGPFDFLIPVHLSCIDEDVTVHNLGVILTFDVVQTPAGNTVTRARITWPTNQFYVERQNGVRYYQPPNAKSILHEFLGPVHFQTITDAWQLKASDGSHLKFQSHWHFELDDAGNVISFKETGSCLET